MFLRNSIMMLGLFAGALSFGKAAMAQQQSGNPSVGGSAVNQKLTTTYNDPLEKPILVTYKMNADSVSVQGVYFPRPCGNILYLDFTDPKQVSYTLYAQPEIVNADDDSGVRIARFDSVIDHGSQRIIYGHEQDYQWSLQTKIGLEKAIRNENLAVRWNDHMQIYELYISSGSSFSERLMHTEEIIIATLALNQN